MNYPCFENNDIYNAYIISQSNGTTAVAEFRLGEEQTLIIAENVAMFSGEMILREAPSRSRLREVPQTNVLASLESSLRKNAAVWRELSKY